MHSLEHGQLHPAAVRSLLQPVSLDQINAVAHLQTRIDRKYLLSAAHGWNTICAADPAAQILEIEGQRKFTYHSTYFDTIDLASFHGAAHRRRRRFKVRIRRYSNSQSYLEVKTRDGRGRSVKHRNPLPVDAWDQLREEDLAEVRRILAQEHIELDPAAPNGPLFAMLETRYTRSTIFLPQSGSRVTVDHDLTWRDPSGRQLTLQNLVIIETKSAHAASKVDRFLWRTGHRQQRISKYAVGLSLMFPDLPANRWHRTKNKLAGHLQPSHRPDAQFG